MTAQGKIDPNMSGKIVGTVELKRIGNSTGFLLPKELMARLNLQAGDKLYVSLSPEGGLRFTPNDPKFEKAMEVARKGMKVYRNALAELAK